MTIKVKRKLHNYLSVISKNEKTITTFWKYSTLKLPLILTCVQLKL